MSIEINSKELEQVLSKQVAGPNHLIACTSQIVSSILLSNPTEPSTVPDLIDQVFEKLNSLNVNAHFDARQLRPAVPVEKSITDEFIICLEDGKKFKMLKKHLMSVYGMSPNEYRRKWNLDPDYPMTAPSYAIKRQELAKKIGLGRKR